jgi:hypothetical protein
MKASEVKEAHPLNPLRSPAKRAYEKPSVTELGDVRALTLGPGVGTKIDGKTGTKRP